MKSSCLIVICLLMFANITLSSSAEETEVDPRAELIAASDYFKNLGISNFNCDIKIIFDPSGRYKMKDIEKWEIAKGTYVFLGHYNYADGGIYSFTMFGETIAKNDAVIKDMQSTIVTPLLPMPGSIMSSDELAKRYTANYKGTVKVDGYDCYRIRLDSNEIQEEFFKSMEYYIDKKDKVIRQVDCAFNLGVWVGNGHGEFFYSRKKGMLMPNVGYGDAYFRSPFPGKQLKLWGKWSGFKMKMFDDKDKDKKEEEIIETETPGEPK